MNKIFFVDDRIIINHDGITHCIGKISTSDKQYITSTESLNVERYFSISGISYILKKQPISETTKKIEIYHPSLVIKHKFTTEISLEVEIVGVLSDKKTGDETACKDELPTFLFITKDHSNNQYIVNNSEFLQVATMEKYFLWNNNLTFLSEDKIFNEESSYKLAEGIDAKNIILLSKHYINDRKLFNFDNECLITLNLENIITSILETENTLVIALTNKVLTYNKQLGNREFCFDYYGEFVDMRIEGERLALVTKEMLFVYEMSTNDLIGEFLLATELNEYITEEEPENINSDENSTDVNKKDGIDNKMNTEMNIRSVKIPGKIIDPSAVIAGTYLVDNVLFCIDKDRLIIRKYILPKGYSYFTDYDHIIALTKGKVKCYKICEDKLSLVQNGRVMDKNFRKQITSGNKSKEWKSENLFDNGYYEDGKIFLQKGNKTYVLNKEGMLLESE